MKKRSAKTSKKQITTEEQMYNFTLSFSDLLNDTCDNIILTYDKLLKFTKINAYSQDLTKRAMHMLNYMSSRMRIIRSLKKRLCKLYTITDHEKFIDEFDSIFSRYYNDLLSSKKVIDYIDYIFKNGDAEEVFISYNLTPLTYFNRLHCSHNKSKYDLVLEWKGETE